MVALDPMNSARPAGDHFPLTAETYAEHSLFEILAHDLPSPLVSADKRQPKESSDEDRYAFSLSNHSGGDLYRRAVRAFSIRHPFDLAGRTSDQPRSASVGTAALGSQSQRLTKDAPTAHPFRSTDSNPAMERMNLNDSETDRHYNPPVCSVSGRQTHQTIFA